MAFSTKRGRPRKTEAARGADTGTPELIMKRLHGLTDEAIDLCLERGIITQQEHWCAIHLRWLYTLKFGVPSVRALDPANLGGIDGKQDNPEWRAEREKEYQEALQSLILVHAAQMVLDVCIYNARPSFLCPPSPADMQTASLSSTRQERDLSTLRAGLTALCKLWGAR